MNNIYLLICKGFGYAAKKNSILRKFLFNIQNKMTLQWLKKHCQHIISKYKKEKAKQINDYGVKYADIVWTCWWQGINDAPETVKLCIESMRKNKGTDKTLVIIDKDNYDSYISLPEVITEKFREGYISVTQLIDIIRVVLLDKYGGIWIDAGVFVIREIPDKYFRMDYWTVKNDYKKLMVISKGRWTNGIMSSCQNGQYVRYSKDMLFKYWQESKVLMNYFLFDCITYIAFMDFQWFQEIWNGIVSENDLFGMETLFNMEYEEGTWIDLEKRSCFYLMSRKRNYKSRVDGKKTFYGYIQERYGTGN